MSYLPNPNAFAVDAFSMTWTNECVYLFFLHLVYWIEFYRKSRDQAEAVLVAPLWPTQMWFPKLLTLIVEQFFILPAVTDILIMPTDPQRQHPLRKMRLGCFRLSGKPLQSENYRKTLLKLSSLPGDHQLRSNIGRTSNDCCCFVTHERLIQLYHL